MILELGIKQFGSNVTQIDVKISAFGVQAFRQ